MLKKAWKVPKTITIYRLIFSSISKICEKEDNKDLLRGKIGGIGLQQENSQIGVILLSR